MKRISHNYIISKGRPNDQKTRGYLLRAGIPHSIVIERGQYEAYREAMPDAELLIIDGDDLGVARARNACLDFAREQGYRVCWTWDDDLRVLQKVGEVNGNNQYRDCVEDFTEIYARAMIKCGCAGACCGFSFLSFACLTPMEFDTKELCMSYAIDVSRVKLRYDESLPLGEDKEFSVRFFLSGFRMLRLNHYCIKGDQYGTRSGGNQGLREQAFMELADGRLLDTYGADYFWTSTRGEARPKYAKFLKEGQRRVIEKALKEARDEIRI